MAGRRGGRGISSSDAREVADDTVCDSRESSIAPASTFHKFNPPRKRSEPPSNSTQLNSTQRNTHTSNNDMPPHPPTLVQRFRQLFGRALRESGQALDRVALRLASFAHHDFYDDALPYQDTLSRHRQQVPLLTSGKPMIDPQVAFVAPCSTLVGSVHVGANVSIWYGAVVRADECVNASSETEMWELSDGSGGGAIWIGPGSNVQDGCILTARQGHCVIGQGVTIGHLAQLHSATVHDYSLIGMGSLLEPGVVVETESLVAAGAVVKAGTVVRQGELWAGNPARKLKDLTAEQRQKLHYQSSEYVTVAKTQASVMELGGNLSDAQIESLMNPLLEENDEGVAAAPTEQEEEEEVSQRDQSATTSEAPPTKTLSSA